jgi:hypothetical protein
MSATLGRVYSLVVSATAATASTAVTAGDLADLGWVVAPAARQGQARAHPTVDSLDTAHRSTAPHATRLHVIDVTQMS